MRTPLLAALAVTLAGTVQAADFEGVLDARLTITAPEKEEGGSGSIRMYVGSAGSRMETEMSTPMGTMKMAVLHLKAKPGVSYMINDEKKTYSELKATPGGDKDEEDEKVTIKRLGNEKVAGYDCAHALITDAKGEQTEIWTTKSLGGAEAFWAAQTGEDRRGTRKYRAMARTLRDAGIDGWPLKFKSAERKGQVVVWETVKVEKRSPPASMFSLSGYTKAEGMAGMGQVKLSPEQQKKMDAAMKQQQQQMQEAMKKMTPEQRKQMEELMKSMGGNPGK